MSFLHPLFLFGLLAISIPIIIHLFHFQRPKTILFTNVRFLKNVKEITTSKLKLKHLLVLMCRIFFLTFLVFAFAQPFISGNKSKRIPSKPNALAYFNNSFSMQSGNAGENLLDLAIRDFSKLSELYPLNTQFQITTNDFEGRDQFLVNKDKLAERLSTINYSYTFRNANNVLKRIDNTSSSTSKNNQLFFFSDFQKSTLGDLSKLALDSNNQYFFVPLQASQKANVFIDSIWLSSPIVRANESNSIEAKVYNTDSKEEKKVLVKLYIDNAQASAAEVTIGPGSSEKLSINFVSTTSGQKKCKLVFDDYPVVFDNNYFFVIEVSPKIKILNLYQSSEGYVKKVYGNEQLFDVISRPISNLDYSQIASSSLIVLEDLKTIPEALANALKAFAQKGGSLVIYPSKDMELNSYNTLLTKLALPTLSAVVVDTGKQSQNNYKVQTPNYQNPFFKNVFEKEDKTIDMPYARPIVDLHGKGEKILIYNNGDLFLSLFKNQNSNTYLLAAPLDEQYTNFPKHAMFVPVMYKIAFESLDNVSRLSYNLQSGNGTYMLPSGFENNESQVFSLEKDSFKIIPQQQIIGKKLSFAIPNIDVAPGIYALKFNNNIIAHMAFNQGKQESETTTYTVEELQEITKNYKNLKIYRADANESFLKEFKEENIGISLWKYCLLAAILFLIGEALLLRFYK